MALDGRPNTLLFGAGGVGTVYLFILSKVTSVTAVCRSNYEVVKKSGFILNSSIFGQNLHITPRVAKNCTEAAAATEKPFDYVLITSKAIPNIIPELIKPAVTPGHTAIVLIQNGIGIESEYAEAFPNNPILSCAVYLPATQQPAGVVKHMEIERLEIGNYPSTSKSPHAEQFAELIKRGGGTAEAHNDIQHKRWTKLLINAAWNPICALTLSNDVAFLQSSSQAADIVFEIMMEVANIATAYGYTITKEQVEFQLGRAKARILKNEFVEPSMFQDVRQGRRMEVEAILGNTVLLAKQKGLSCEKLEMIYVLAKALDLSISKRL